MENGEFISKNSVQRKIKIESYKEGGDAGINSAFSRVFGALNEWGVMLQKCHCLLLGLKRCQVLV